MEIITIKTAGMKMIIQLQINSLIIKADNQD